MLRGTLKRKGPGGATVIEFDIPSTLKELPLNRFIDFLVECRKMDEDADNAAEYVCKAVQAFTGFPIADVIYAEFESYSADGILDSVSRIFSYALGLIGNAKGSLMTAQNAVFKYKDEEYRIPVILQQAIAGEVILPGLSTIEVIEVAEVHRFKKQVTENRGDPDGKLRKKIRGMFEESVKEFGDPEGKIAKRQAGFEANELEKAGDPDGSLLFTTYLKTLAILSRKEGESLPVNDADREAWIQNRASHFSEIDAGTALDIDFFLTSFLPNYEAGRLVAGFLRGQSFAATAATLLKKGKRSTGRKDTAKKSLRRSAGDR